jgi:hypothetical protein
MRVRVDVPVSLRYTFLYRREPETTLTTIFKPQG